MIIFPQSINFVHGLVVLERHHLAILRAVEQHGSLTAAADSLCLTQSALSHAIKKLEQQLGAVLWHKEGRGLRFSPAGDHLLALANRMLPQFEQAEEIVAQMAQGRRGMLRIGMECHPCYRWLLKVVDPYLQQWPDVDVDVKQKFQFGGIGALFAHEIDVLVTPDPLFKSGLEFEPVFDYEQVLVVAETHHLASYDHVEPEQLSDQNVITYPVEIERLDVFAQFLLPAGCAPRKHQTIETTDIMLQMVAADRGVAALPRWLVMEYMQSMPIRPVKLGKEGIAKQIYLGTRKRDNQVDFIAAFVKLAGSPSLD